MGRWQRTKGVAAERELVNALLEHGIKARRVPLSGSMSASGFGGDVLARLTEEEWVIECKRLGQGFKKIHAWLKSVRLVAFRGDRQEWCVCLRLEHLVELCTDRRAAMGLVELVDQTATVETPGALMRALESFRSALETERRNPDHGRGRAEVGGSVEPEVPAAPQKER